MYEDNDMRKDDSFATGSYYDTSSSYTHYDSAEAMKQPKKPKKKGGFGKNGRQVPGIGAGVRQRIRSRVHRRSLRGRTADRRKRCIRDRADLDNGFAYYCIYTEQRCVRCV